MDLKGLLWSGSGSNRFDDRELSFPIHMAVDAKLPLHCQWSSTRTLFRGLARQLCSNEQRLLWSCRNGEVITVATEITKAQLSAGQLIPDFRLSAANRDGEFGTWDYKQHRNLVLIFFRSVEVANCKQLLREITEHYVEYQEKEAEVLVISSDEMDRLQQLTHDLALPFPVLSDNDGSVTLLYLQDTQQGAESANFEAAIFVTDRWGEIFACKTVENDSELVAEAEIREWLGFIELQCEECFPSEWTI